MKTKAVRYLQFLLGLVFIFSGFVKAVDPTGTMYKLQDYFGVLHLEFLAGYAGLLAVLLISFEFITGIMLTFNLFPRIAIIFATALLIVFTPLTLYLALTNPISDCGCFGDALKLTNWQTFWKNVVFDVAVIILWFNWKNIANTKLSPKKQGLWLTVSLILILGFQIYNLSCLPIIDFRPYKKGVNIKEALAHQPKAKFKTVLIYKNKQTGELKEFTEDNYPWDDTVHWQWVDTKVKKVTTEVPAESIHDFYFTNQQGQDITDSLLSLSQPVVIIIAHNLSKTNIKGLKRIIIWFTKNKQKYFPVLYCATASSPAQIQQTKDKLGRYAAIVEFLTSDATTLKTIVRSNPGVIIIKDGVLIDKNCWRKIKP